MCWRKLLQRVPYGRPASSFVPMVLCIVCAYIAPLNAAADAPRTKAECLALVESMDGRISAGNRIYDANYSRCTAGNTIENNHCWASWDFKGAQLELRAVRSQRDNLSGQCYQLAEREFAQRLLDQKNRDEQTRKQTQQQSQSMQVQRERQLQMSAEQYENQRTLEQRKALGDYAAARKKVESAQRVRQLAGGINQNLMDILQRGAAKTIAETEDQDEDEDEDEAYTALHDTAKDALDKVPMAPGTKIIRDVMNDALKSRNNQTIRDVKGATSAIRSFEPGSTGSAESPSDSRWKQTTPNPGAATPNQSPTQGLFRDPITGILRRTTNAETAAPGDNPALGEAGCTRDGLGRVTVECEKVRADRMSADIMSRITKSR